MTISQQTKRTRTSSLGWMIQRIGGRLNRQMEARLGEHGLSVPQFAIMMTVLERDGLTQAEIGQSYGMPAYAISRAIDHLEDTGLLERRPHPTSRRAHTIHTTPAGQDLGPTLFGIVKDVNAELAAPLSAEERKTFAALLRKIL
ncbi:MAG: MarR family winged helix-turn-helix transcriptional regulator [Silicimonas sp.]|nr:MarR family winged helix-turn-helix transcriptional regulator [Silicimonas sp.]